MNIHLEINGPLWPVQVAVLNDLRRVAAEVRTCRLAQRTRPMTRWDALLYDRPNILDSLISQCRSLGAVSRQLREASFVQGF